MKTDLEIDNKPKRRSIYEQPMAKGDPLRITDEDVLRKVRTNELTDPPMPNDISIEDIKPIIRRRKV